MIEEQEQEQIAQITIKYANSGKVYSDRVSLDLMLGCRDYPRKSIDDLIIGVC